MILCSIVIGPRCIYEISRIPTLSCGYILVCKMSNVLLASFCLFRWATWLPLISQSPVDTQKKYFCRCNPCIIKCWKKVIFCWKNMFYLNKDPKKDIRLQKLPNFYYFQFHSPLYMKKCESLLLWHFFFRFRTQISTLKYNCKKQLKQNPTTHFLQIVLGFIVQFCSWHTCFLPFSQNWHILNVYYKYAFSN